MKFKLIAEDAGARLGIVETAHGNIETPIFMPVGTVGSVKALTQEMLEELGAQIILGNTYHLYLRPGHELVASLGGLHRFISWPKPILTDSGGFQVFSLSQMNKKSEEGVTFKSHIDGSSHLLTPERSMQIQLALGSDIIMAFDECTPYPATEAEVAASLSLTTRWAKRSLAEFNRLTGSCSGESEGSALFAIVQGGVFRHMRTESARQLIELDLPGYAIGGLSVGEEKNYTYEVTDYTAPMLPREKPRYLMGVGTPEDLVECVARGVDMFDCVMPTRNARNGQLFTSRGRLNIKNSRYMQDQSPPDPNCSCKVCRRYSRAYLRHLYRVGEILGSVLSTYHNIHFYLDTMRKIRHSIRLCSFADFRKNFLYEFKSGEVE
ncbi:MAG: tRNA guanosine(34) transglycosylase Tgt [Blastocatellia bacterium]|nr:tRNA guanosine(34) transglycosylase Tgt [Blastocatellia bacterium]